MDRRIALIGIIVTDDSSVERLNRILHEFGEYIIGRMGIPYKQEKMSIISIAMDGPMDVINSLSGKLGMLKGISTKTIYVKTHGEKDE